MKPLLIFQPVSLFSSGDSLSTGLDNIAALTSGMDQELRIDLYDREKTHYYASYKEFQVDDGSFMYRLHVRNYYNGTAGRKL